jgi:RimJ/RimL family protein N-acetyltransferase
MDLIIETERLILRELLLTDTEAMFKMDSNPIVHQYLWNKPTETVDETRTIIEYVRQQYIDYNIGRFAVVLKETNEFMGWAGLKYNDKELNNRINFYDIGYRLDEPFWGNGYASEASFAWLDYAFNTMKIQKMDAAAQAKNVASNRILQKIGMQKTEQYLEDEVVWNWYELENKSI